MVLEEEAQHTFVWTESARIANQLNMDLYPGGMMLGSSEWIPRVLLIWCLAIKLNLVFQICSLAGRKNHSGGQAGTWLHQVTQDPNTGFRKSERGLYATNARAYLDRPLEVASSAPSIDISPTAWCS